MSRRKSFAVESTENVPSRFDAPPLRSIPRGGNNTAVSHTPSPSAIQLGVKSPRSIARPHLFRPRNEIFRTRFPARVGRIGGDRGMTGTGLVRGGIGRGRGEFRKFSGLRGQCADVRDRRTPQTRRGAGPVRKRNFGRLRAVKRLRPFNRPGGKSEINRFCKQRRPRDRPSDEIIPLAAAAAAADNNTSSCIILLYGRLCSAAAAAGQRRVPETYRKYLPTLSRLRVSVSFKNRVRP